MGTQPTCPSCGKPLAGDAPQGICPECLMKAGMGSTASATGGSGGFVPPGVHEIAQLFPQLEILELIGHGGMGAVYKARQPGLDRLVALKILPPRPGDDPGFADRFTREARALARLSHPNIVAVYDFGQTGRLHYFIMEYVDGPNLRRVEQSSRLAPREALRIIPQICEALQFAHDEGIVHRDIKPENVLLDKKGRVKIADFGLAKLLGQPPQNVRLTGTRDVMGTPHYMAPEQVEHPQAVDHRADIFSLGVVFYEMLTGELPLGRFGPPSSRAHDISIDVRLDEVVLRTLEREPERRYQQAVQLKTDLESIRGSPAQTPEPRPTGGGLPRDERLRKEIRLPAVGLLVTGILNWVLLPFALYFLLPAFSRPRPFAVQAPTQPLTEMALLVVLATPFVLCSFMMYAALKMMRLEAYRAAIAASIVAMFITPGNLVGFPIGVWALVTLARREIRAAFHQAREARPPQAKSAGWNVSVRYLLWGATVVVVVLAGLLTTWGLRHRPPIEPASTPVALLAATAADKPITQDLVLTDGAWQASCNSTQVFRLFEVPEPDVENCTVLYQAKVRTEGLEGRAYLEMWCRFPGRGEAFSRGLDNTVSGTTSWATCQTPFFLKSGEKPDLIRLNLVVQGPGKAFIKDIRLEAFTNR
jgi:predicted Ser/Thr protein kinase